MRALPFILLGLLVACSPAAPPEAEDAGLRPAASPAATPAAAAMGTVEPPARSFRAWEAACDNTRSCTLFGFPSAEEGGGMAGVEGWGFVRIERAGAAGAEPAVTLAAGESTGAGPALPMEAAVDGGRAFRLEASAEAGPYYAGELRGAEAAAFVAAIRNGRTVRITVRGFPAGVVSLDGAAAALLWTDERQGRTAGGTPGAAPPPVVTAVRPLGGKMTAPPALQRFRDGGDCAVEQVGVGGGDGEIIGTRLTAELVLWEVPCGSGAYNFTTAFYFGDAAGGGLRPVPLRADPGESDRPAHHLVNAGLDGGRIEAFSKARGVGDCGSVQAWVWDGRSFVQVEERTMGRCEGVVVDHWPVLRRAMVKPAG